MLHLAAHSLPATNGTLLTITPPQTRHAEAPEAALDLVFVFDVSCSMDNYVGKSDEVQLSLLDVAKHAFRLALAMLPATARVSIVTFSDTASVVCGFVACDEAGKKKLSDTVLQLRTIGCTNLAAGIQTAMLVAKGTPAQVVVLCDGMPTPSCHPKGYGDDVYESYTRALDEWRPAGVQMTCLGIGYQLDSQLLGRLGTLLHIPDGGDVAPYVVHMMAWMRTLCARSVVIECATTDGRVRLVDVGECVYDVPRHVVVPDDVATAQLVVEGQCVGDTVVVHEEATAQMATTALEWHRACTALDEMLSAPSCEARRARLVALLETADDAAASLTTTLRTEVALAVQDEATWRRWGAHYVRTFRAALGQCRCANFRDLALQPYTRDAAGQEARFEAVRCEGELAFARLEVVTSHGKKQQPLSDDFMRGGGCVHGDTCVVVQTQDGTHKRKAAHELERGDMVQTPSGFATVRYVCETVVPGKVACLVHLGDLRITSWHPVVHDGAWTFPVNVAYARPTACDRLITLVLEKDHIFLAAGVPCVALGHEFGIGHFAHHDFWGKDVVTQFPGLADADGRVDMGRVDVWHGAY
jgi:hypothetical protein